MRNIARAVSSKQKQKSLYTFSLVYKLFRAYFRKGCRLLFSQQIGSFQCDGFAAADQKAAAAVGPGKIHSFG